MDKQELIELLDEIAMNDIEDAANIDDHPCRVAIRAIDKCFDDIEMLRNISPKKAGSKKVQMLTGSRYNPSW